MCCTHSSQTSKRLSTREINSLQVQFPTFSEVILRIIGHIIFLSLFKYVMLHKEKLSFKKNAGHIFPKRSLRRGMFFNCARKQLWFKGEWEHRLL